MGAIGGSHIPILATLTSIGVGVSTSLMMLDNFEYLFDNLRYIGKNIFIMRRLGNVEKTPDIDEGALTAYKKMHANNHVRVEWGIGGLKCKF